MSSVLLRRVPQVCLLKLVVAGISGGCRQLQAVCWPLLPLVYQPGYGRKNVSEKRGDRPRHPSFIPNIKACLYRVRHHRLPLRPPVVILHHQPQQPLPQPPLPVPATHQPRLRLREVRVQLRQLRRLLPVATTPLRRHHRLQPRHSLVLLHLRHLNLLQ